jgi:ATP-dependent RNA helicase
MSRPITTGRQGRGGRGEGREGRGRTDYDKTEDMHISLSDDVDVLPSFDAMGLKEDLLRGVYAYGDSY